MEVLFGGQDELLIANPSLAIGRRKIVVRFQPACPCTGGFRGTKISENGCMRCYICRAGRHGSLQLAGAAFIACEIDRSLSTRFQPSGHFIRAFAGGQLV